jgi:hypothetical protein
LHSPAVSEASFLAQNAWHEETARAGSEIQLTLAAIAGEYRICQSFLGTKEHVERHSADLVPAMRQTVGALFSSLEPNFSLWSTKTGSQPILTTGAEQEFTWSHCESTENGCERCSRPESPSWNLYFGQFFLPRRWQNSSESLVWMKPLPLFRGIVG